MPPMRPTAFPHQRKQASRGNYGDSAPQSSRRAHRPVGLMRLRASRAPPTDLRVKSNFSNRIKLFLPVQSLPKKYSGFPKPQISFITPPSTPLEGRIAIVTDAGLDAMDASGASDESANLRTEKSCGPDASTPASSL